VANDHVEVVRVLCEKGADLEIEDAEGLTALYSAVEDGKAEMVRVLVGAGANPNGTKDTSQCLSR